MGTWISLYRTQIENTNQLKAVINKKNNQINVSLPRKQISKKVLNKILRGKKIRAGLW